MKYFVSMVAFLSLVVFSQAEEVPTDEQLKKDPIEAHATASSKSGYSAKKIFGFFIFKDFEQLDYMPKAEP